MLGRSHLDLCEYSPWTAERSSCAATQELTCCVEAIRTITWREDLTTSRRIDYDAVRAAGIAGACEAMTEGCDSVSLEIRSHEIYVVAVGHECIRGLKAIRSWCEGSCEWYRGCHRSLMVLRLMYQDPGSGLDALLVSFDVQ